MSKLCMAMATSALLLAAAPAARAQDRFGSAGQFALSAERLFGVVISSQSTDEAGVTSTLTYTSINLLFSPFNALTTTYSFPRLGGDYFAANGVSLGAALGYATFSSSSETEIMGMSEENDGGGFGAFLFAPRVGFAHMFQGPVGIWPRVGVTYVSASEDPDEGDTTESSSNRLAVTVELPLVFVPAPHAAITIGPTLDLGVSGADKVEYDDPATADSEQDVTATEYGLQAGLAIFF